VKHRLVRILSYNVHKGSSAIRRRNVLAAIRDAIHALDADIVFLQEVKGEPRRHRAHAAGTDAILETQFEYLAAGIWPHTAYGPNVVRDSGHHGNAVLSRFPIASWENIDISAHPIEGRGILHAVLEVPGPHKEDPPRDLHALCLHLGLFEHWRKRQIERLEARIRSSVPDDAPLVVAGDFNDWRERAAGHFAHELHLAEAFQELHGDHARTFPSRLPTFKLDRVYTRGVAIVRAVCLHGKPWDSLSDHVPLLLEVM
jgi:endonuclease/exonuclease/phosphatase family metal-dependent hydrolase